MDEVEEQDVQIEYEGHGIYALYIHGELFKKYNDFMEAVIDYEERSETL